jgi:hypothetical protein
VLFDVLHDDRIAVREEAVLVLRTLLDRHRQQVGIFRELFLDRAAEIQAVLPA